MPKTIIFGWLHTCIERLLTKTRGILHCKFLQYLWSKKFPCQYKCLTSFLQWKVIFLVCLYHMTCAYRIWYNYKCTYALGNFWYNLKYMYMYTKNHYLFNFRITIVLTCTCLTIIYTVSISTVDVDVPTCICTCTCTSKISSID